MMKLLLEIALKLRRCYWWLVRPTTKGARAILVGSDGKILLLRHKYDKEWFLPGGKSKRNETPEQTLKRELEEELGVTDIQHASVLGEYQNEYEYKKDTITVFVVSLFSLSPKMHFEVEEWNFFDSNALPDNTSPGTKRRVQEWLKKQPVNGRW